MDLKALVARKQVLQGVRDKALAQANAANGAIQECDYWIEQLSQAVQSAKAGLDTGGGGPS